MIDLEQDLRITKIYVKRLEKVMSMCIQALKEIKEGMGIPHHRASITLEEAERMMNEEETET